MKTIVMLLILASALAMPAIGALDDADLDKIRLIVKAEIEVALKPLKADIDTLQKDVGTLKEAVARFDGRLTGVEKQVAHATNVTYGLIALIVVAIGIPAWRGKRDRALEKQIETLTQEIETLKQQQIVRP